MSNSFHRRTKLKSVHRSLRRVLKLWPPVTYQNDANYQVCFGCTRQRLLFITCAKSKQSENQALQHSGQGNEHVQRFYIR